MRQERKLSSPVKTVDFLVVTEVLDIVHNFTIISVMIMTMYRRQNSVKENFLISLATISVSRSVLLGVIDDLYVDERRTGDEVLLVLT
jgi:hypothetical protein